MSYAIRMKQVRSVIPEVLALRRLRPREPWSPEIQDQPGNIDPVSEDNVNNNKN